MQRKRGDGGRFFSPKEKEEMALALAQVRRRVQNISLLKKKRERETDSSLWILNVIDLSTKHLNLTNLICKVTWLWPFASSRPATAGSSPGNSRWDRGADDSCLVALSPASSLLSVNSTLPDTLHHSLPVCRTFFSHLYSLLSHRHTPNHSGTTGFLLFSLHLLCWSSRDRAMWLLSLWTVLVLLSEMENGFILSFSGQALKTSLLFSQWCSFFFFGQ